MAENFVQNDAERDFFNNRRTREKGKETFSSEVLQIAQQEATVEGCTLEGYPYEVPKEVKDGESWSAPRMFRVMENGKYTGVCYEWMNNKWTFPRGRKEFDSLEDALNQVIFDETTTEETSVDLLEYASREAGVNGCVLDGYPYKKPTREEIIDSGISWRTPQSFRVMKDGKYTGVVYGSDHNDHDTWSIPAMEMKEFDVLADALDFFNKESARLDGLYKPHKLRHQDELGDVLDEAA